jgi:predicted nucleic acid-binding protein
MWRGKVGCPIADGRELLLWVDTCHWHKSLVGQERTVATRTEVSRYRSLERLTCIVHACRDPKDDKFLQLAVNGNADFIIAGDDDLLVLNPFHGFPIITPASYLR